MTTSTASKLSTAGFSKIRLAGNTIGNAADINLSIFHRRT